jgi:hypothetical protein
LVTTVGVSKLLENPEERKYLVDVLVENEI